MKPTDENTDSRLTRRREILASGAGLAAAGVAGCMGGDGDDGSDGSDGSDGDDGSDGSDGGSTPAGTQEMVSVHQPLLEGSMYIPALYYGRDQGVFEEHGIDISFEVTGFGKFTRTFTDDLTEGLSTLSALPLMEQAATGTPVSIFGQTMNFVNQCFVRADSDIEDPTDLEGKTLGVPYAGSSTTRTYIAMWDEQFGFDLMNDTGDIVDTAPSSLYQFLQDGEVDAAILFTSFTIAALANEDTRSIYHPGTAWEESTGYPPSVNLWGVYNDWLEENPQKVIDFQDAWWESIDLFRNNYDDAMAQYAALGGLGAEDEAEIEVVRGMVENEELFNQEWDENWIDANLELGDAVAARDGIEEAPTRDHYLTRDEIKDMT